ncbi:hypothetical protein [Falsiroseomonas sp. HW251]|uniref:hypothetical protein n=1 Tax=Falsiroseomonas sp. HW251 TaxID=3390998 RepID=UPI003D321934
MARSIVQTFIPAAPAGHRATLLQHAAHLFARLAAARAARLTAGTLAALSPEQRRDIGAATLNRPTIEVERSVMTNLTSLR